MTRRFVEVALPPPIARELTYGVPPELAVEAQTGALVLVPIMQRMLTGIVLGPAALGNLAPGKVRNIEQILDTSLLSPEVVDICRWMAGYYIAPLGSALMAALPPGVKLTSNRMVELRDGASSPADGLDAQIVDEIQRDGPLKVSTLKLRLGSKGLEKSLRALRRQGQIEIAPVLDDKRTRTLSQRHYRPCADAVEIIPQIEKRAPRQAACLRHLLDSPDRTARNALIDAGFSAAILRGLEQRGLIEAYDEEIIRDPLAHIDSAVPDDLALTTDQQQTLNILGAALDNGGFYPSLLHGVTGSGKTLIYIRLAARAG